MSNEPTDLQVLREILLAQDRKVLEALQRELEDIKNRLDDPAQFLKVIEPVIGEALAQHTRSHPDEVAAALAPAIAKAVKYQVEENKDAMITALMPIIGALIARSVREAFQNLARRVDEQLRRATSFQFIFKRLWARLRGIPAEELLRDVLPWRPVAVFLIHNDSGLILSQAYRESDFSDKDPYMTAALLTAIRNFARETFGNGKPGILYELETDPYTVLMEEGPDVYIAWVGEDVPPADARERLWLVLENIYARYGSVLSRGDLAIDPDEIRPMLEPLLVVEKPTSVDRRPPVLGLAIVTGVIVGILFLCSWGAYRMTPRFLAHFMPTVAVYMTPTPTPSPTVPASLPLRPTFTPTPPSQSRNLFEKSTFIKGNQFIGMSSSGRKAGTLLLFTSSRLPALHNGATKH